MKYKYKIIKKGEKERKVRKVKQNTDIHTQLQKKTFKNTAANVNEKKNP